MNLTPAQKIIAKDNHRFRVINCGRRFGKTTEAIEEIKGKALAGRKGDKIAYIAPTIQQARDIAWNMLKSELRPITLKTKEAPSLEIEVMNKDGEPVLIILRGWEAIETLRGQSFIFVILDEVASMRNFWLHWEQVISPALTDRIGDALFISTPKGFNHFYDLYNKQEKDPDFKSFHFTSYDNPHLPVSEIERQKKSLSENSFAQEFMADFRKQEGLVYKEFDRSRDVFDDLAPRKSLVEKIAGVDFGFTNPAVVLEIEHDADNHFWVMSEWYKRGKTNDEVIAHSKTLGINIFYPDPAEPDRIEEMRRAGLNVREVSKDIEKGIDSVRELFKQGRLHIHNSCKNLISELETYAYPEKRPNKNEPELPVKENDHALDALRYALYNNQPLALDMQEDFGLYVQSFT